MNHSPYLRKYRKIQQGPNQNMIVNNLINNNNNMCFLLHLNEDFDDDLLMEAVDLIA